MKRPLRYKFNRENIGDFMNNFIVLILFIVGMIISIVALHRKGGIYRSISKSIIVITLLFLAYIIIIGPSFRLSARSAAEANSFIHKEDEWLGMTKLNKNEFHMFYDPLDKVYRTVFVEKYLFGYRSTISTYLYPHKEDELRTIGAMNVSRDNEAFSAFMVISDLSNIRKVALVNSDGDILVSKSIGVNKPVTLAYDYSRRENYMNCELVAYDKKGTAQYYYGYKHGNSQLRDDEYKWYSY